MDQSIRRMVGRLPQSPGVYRFRNARGRVLYIGRATELRSRVASYWSDLRDRRHLVPMVAGVAKIEAVACDSPHEAAWLERNLLEEVKPRWNRTAGGQESPVYIKMDTRAGAPGLRVAYLTDSTTEGVRFFGPYLGGLRARQAVSALHRIRPLAYTGNRLSGAERDMARKRGIGEGDRDALVDAVTAILHRQPEAVDRARAELEQMRDRAADSLAFELAGQIQAELQAMDWTTAPQRATTLTADDFTVYGWSGGVLVCFTMRAGRLCEWSQSRCTQSRATKLMETPGPWTDFARRNAELAAALAPEPT